MGLEGSAKKNKVEKLIRQAGLAAMVATKLVSADPASAHAMAGNREALKKLNSEQNRVVQVLNPKQEHGQGPPEKKEVEFRIKEDAAESRGFTLIELLAVIGIIALLASIVLASLNSARKSAKVARVKADLAAIHDAIGFLEVDSGQWPGHQLVDMVQSGNNNELEDLNVPAAGLVTTDGAYPKWSGPYIAVVPKDPWGNNYFLDTDYDIDPGPGVKNAAVIGSYGPNGVGLNQYDSDDIYMVLASQ